MLIKFPFTTFIRRLLGTGVKAFRANKEPLCTVSNSWICEPTRMSQLQRVQNKRDSQSINHGSSAAATVDGRSIPSDLRKVQIFDGPISERNGRTQTALQKKTESTANQLVLTEVCQTTQPHHHDQLVLQPRQNAQSPISTTKSHRHNHVGCPSPTKGHC
jgi:hypothetical protein